MVQRFTCLVVSDLGFAMLCLKSFLHTKQLLSILEFSFYGNYPYFNHISLKLRFEKAHDYYIKTHSELMKTDSIC